MRRIVPACGYAGSERAVFSQASSKDCWALSQRFCRPVRPQVLRKEAASLTVPAMLASVLLDASSFFGRRPRLPSQRC